LNLPQREITAERLARWPEGTLFVVYCAGPHCNGADRAAWRLAGLGRPDGARTAEVGNDG